MRATKEYRLAMTEEAQKIVDELKERRNAKSAPSTGITILG